MTALRHPVLHWALALVVGGVFIYASIDKIQDPRAFAKIIYHYQVIGPNSTVGFANGAIMDKWTPATEGSGSACVCESTNPSGGRPSARSPAMVARQ